MQFTGEGPEVATQTWQETAVKTYTLLLCYSLKLKRRPGTLDVDFFIRFILMQTKPSKQPQL